MKLKLLALVFMLNTLPAFADEVEVRPLPENAASEASTLPLSEKAFVDAISNFDKAAIVAQLGDPATADDVRLKGSDKVVASIWHYHYVNTDEDGTFYQTTELDFIDNKVVQVVFLNNDGSDASEGQRYEIDPQKLPQGIAPQVPSNNEPGDGVPMINMDETK